MRILIISTAMAALLASQALAQTPPPAVPGGEALTPELFPEPEPARPVQIAALGNPPAGRAEPPLAPAPPIEPAPLAAPAAGDVARDASAREPILDLTATPD